MKYILVFVLFILACFCSFAQTRLDSIQQLDEVIISDTKLTIYAAGIKVEVLNDSVLKNNSKSLTELLAFNSNLYFKENGLGMVSSPSFRGTNAAQTAVIWNGININSQLNGQTDFNTINTNSFNSIAIRSGGGSVQYGSGAIGGSIHLNNTLQFNEHIETVIKTGYGSFNSKNLGFNSSLGSKKWSANVGISYVDSDNDYKYLGTNKVNENGEFNNLNSHVDLGFFISDKDVLKLYQQTYISDRHFSGTLSTPSISKYEDENFRTMIEWSRISGKIISKFKVAHLHELFKYFENKDKDNYTFGNVNTFLLNHNFNIRLNDKIQFKTILEYTDLQGQGSSFKEPSRNAFSATALFNHKPNNLISYGINVRKDFTSGFESPFIFSVDAGFDLFEHYKVQINGSKNYRIPTFNDLYWTPGGNLGLVPESSYQIDLGQELSFKYFNFKLNGYYIKTDDLIQWLPNMSGIWSPINIAKSDSYGVELELKSAFNFNAHYFSFSSHYSYTVSENTETKKQLIYVPFHKGNLSLAYNHKKISANYQFMYNGDVFTTEDNLRGYFYSLESYHVSNIGCHYKIFETNTNELQVGILINNLFNKNYQNVAYRPMPNRNFNIQLHYKF